MKTYWKSFTYFLVLALLITSNFYIIKYIYQVHMSQKESQLLNQYSANKLRTLQEKQKNIHENTITPEEKEDKRKTERMLQLEALQQENNDIIGWIEIENTPINYPVLQGTDNTFYMNHNYKKQKSTNGAIFLDKDYCWNPPSDNLLIYGHNMKNHTMFQYLLDYSSPKFYQQHPNIRFTTTNEDMYYEIIAVFQSRVYYQSEKNVFRYYYFIHAENETQYNNYVQNAKKASLYETGKTAIYGEQLLTLSTCSYHIKDGRFVVVAKKVIEGSP